MIREALRLGAVVAIVAWTARGLPVELFLIVAGVLPALWWSSSAWEADEVDLHRSFVVALLAAAPAALLGVARTPHLVPALLLGAVLAMVRLRPARVKTVAGEDWARRNAHRYRPGRADRPIPDTASSDPYALLLGWWRPRPMPPPPLDVPPEHERFVGRDGEA
jgi:hypothetical protein